MDVMNIDLKVLGELLAFLPGDANAILDFGRTLSLVPLATVYMWVALIVPLVLALFMIVAQKPLLSVMWISVLMCGLALIIIAVVGERVPAERLLLLNLTLPPDTFTAFLIAGVTMCACYMLRHAVVSYWGLRTEVMKAKFKIRLAAERAKAKDVRGLQESLLGHLKDKDAPKTPFVICRSASLAMLFLILSQVSILNQLNLDPAARATLRETAELQFLFTDEVEYLCFAVAALFGLHAVLGLCRFGVHILNEIVHLLNKFVLAIVLLLLSLLYMPVTRQLLTVFICVEFPCAQGEWYPKQALHPLPPPLPHR